MPDSSIPLIKFILSRIARRRLGPFIASPPFKSSIWRNFLGVWFVGDFKKWTQKFARGDIKKGREMEMISHLVDS